MIKITVADQIRAPGQHWVITSKYWAEARCDYMFVTGECHAVTRHVSRVTLSQLSQLFGTHQLFSHSLSLRRVTLLCVRKYSWETMQSCVMCLDPKQGTDERAALGNVWVIRFNKSDKITSHVTFVFCGCHQHGLIWLLDSWLCVWWLDALYISFYCLLMRTEFK